MTVFQKNFQFSRYEDAPELSDQLLLPNLAIGNNIFLVSAFVPSYVQRVVRDLATSPEIEPGHLSITFYVPGNLVRESEGIERFRTYLVTGCGSLDAASEFVDDCLQLIEEGGLSVQVTHGPGKNKAVKGCFGVFTDPSSEDYVAIEDSRGGDFNSPIHPLRSWVPEQVDRAEKVLWRTNVVLEGSRQGLYLVDWQNSARWLSLISKWFDKSAEEQQSEKGTDADGLEDSFDEDEFFAQFLDVEEDVGWNNDEEMFDLESFFSAGYSVPVTETDVEGHHIPPLPENIANIVGLASAECPCGLKFLRVNGCPSIAW